MKNLNKLYWLKKEIKQIEELIEALPVISANAMTGMSKGSGISSPVENYYYKLDKLETKLNKKKMELVLETERIESYIETIEDVEIRVLARARFIENKSWQTIGDENYMDRTTAYRKLNNYIKETEGAE